MPLDPDAQQFLKEWYASHPVPTQELTPDQLRADLRLAGTASSVPTADVQIPCSEGTVAVRIYRPETGQSHPLPTLVYVHGGGWMHGTLDMYNALCSAFAQAVPATVIAVDYRLAPEHKFPAALDDVIHAVQWAHETSELGDAPRPVAIAGDSSGGNLAAAACLALSDREGPALAGQLLIYPATDHAFETASYHRNAEGYFLSREAMRWYWSQYLPSADAGATAYASPLRAQDLTGAPPAVIVVAEYDPLFDDGRAYADRLRASGVPVEIIDCEGMVHGFMRRLDQFRRARELVPVLAASVARWFHR